MSEREWEQVTARDGDLLERIEVPGGWLYRSTQVGDDARVSESMTFVADKAVDQQRRERLLSSRVSLSSDIEKRSTP